MGSGGGVKNDLSGRHQCKRCDALFGGVSKFRRLVGCNRCPHDVLGRFELWIPCSVARVSWSNSIVICAIGICYVEAIRGEYSWCCGPCGFALKLKVQAFTGVAQALHHCLPYFIIRLAELLPNVRWVLVSFKVIAQKIENGEYLKIIGLRLAACQFCCNVFRPKWRLSVKACSGACFPHLWLVNVTSLFKSSWVNYILIVDLQTSEMLTTVSRNELVKPSCMAHYSLGAFSIVHRISY